jgi:histidine phosphotransfer protein HptB
LLDDARARLRGVGCLQMGDAMLVNRDRLAALRGEIGEDGFDEVVDLFLRESEEVVARLGTQRQGGLSEADLHFLKGSALTLGFDDLADLCRQSETGAEVHPATLQDVWERSRAALWAA